MTSKNGPSKPPDVERRRLAEDEARTANWKRWGPYISERQWGTVREDYSPHGTSWDAVPHDHARSRAYRWGEDGLLGISDRQGRLNFALALWNGRDPILKERLFGLAGPEGNHGEDVKELYYYLDSSPTHSYLKAMYRYGQGEYPYTDLVRVNRDRGIGGAEYEVEDTGLFDDDRYFDVIAEYAKASPDDILIRITVVNRGPEAAALRLMPTLWFRNTWSWGRSGEGFPARPTLALDGRGIMAAHETLGSFRLDIETGLDGPPDLLFTENDTNTERLFGTPNNTPFVKDAFHDYVVNGRLDAVNRAGVGTKAAVDYALHVPARGEVTVRLRLTAVGERSTSPFDGFDDIVASRRAETDAFYESILPAGLTDDERLVSRQGYAGLLWSKQFYHYIVSEWLGGDPAQPPSPEERRRGRNNEWRHLHNRDVISMPDKWEYPWYAAWDLAFHMIPFAKVDPAFAKQQLLLFLREWYMHPNGQIPAYEWALGDVNPPVHAWAVWRVYKLTGEKGHRDRAFLESAFQKLLLNFTWWVNRKDVDGHNLFSGGFLGLDNVGVFDRSAPLPTGGHLEQADGTAWMAFYCGTMLSMALELAQELPAYEDMASKFFEHYLAIADAMNTLGGRGLWNDEDGFYYDQLHVDHQHIPLQLRSMVGIIPLFAVEVLEQAVIDRLPGFRKRMEWFIENRPEVARHIAFMMGGGKRSDEHRRLLAIPSREKLARVLHKVLDETEFLSPHGIRSLSKVYGEEPYVFRTNGDTHVVNYVPGESNTGLFGGNSNWRGPVWFPVNFLLIEALERYHHFYGDSFQVECPTGSGRMMTLREVAVDIASRLGRLFLADSEGRRPCHGDNLRYGGKGDWKDLVLFYEYFHGETGRGVGASHQTGWTSLVLPCLEMMAAQRSTGVRPERVAVTS